MAKPCCGFGPGHQAPKKYDRAVAVVASARFTSGPLWRRGEEAEAQGEGEPDRTRSHASSLNSVFVCSSQNSISISRYIVAAIVRCSCASCRLPARR